MCFLSYTDVVYSPGTCFGILQYYEKGTILLEAQNLDIWSPTNDSTLCLNTLRDSNLITL